MASLSLSVAASKWSSTPRHLGVRRIGPRAYICHSDLPALTMCCAQSTTSWSFRTMSCVFPIFCR